MSQFTDVGAPVIADMRSLGATGLNRPGGYVREDLLPQLAGVEASRIFKDMGDNDPVCGGILYAIMMMVRGVKWRVEPASSRPEDQEAAEFLETCMYDMRQTWTDTIAEILSMVQYGFSLHEIVYKRRGGQAAEKFMRSRYNDGRIGWRDLPIRSQDTLTRWHFDQTGDILAVDQLAPPDYRTVLLPLQKCILFRTTTHKNTPTGRALDPQTPIPTPDGWRQMGELQVGDKIFDEKGRVRYVVNRAEWANRPCYRVNFRDGSHVVADANHEWVATEKKLRDRKLGAGVFTTQKMFETQRVKGYGAHAHRGLVNYTIARTEPLDYPTQQLLLDPYYLGYWLGNGHSRTGDVTCHAQDADEIASELSNRGFVTHVIQNGPEGCLGRLVRVQGSTLWGDDAPGRALRVLGLIRNKHVPKAYLRGNIQQRRELLAGLLDSDGTTNADGQVEFTNTNMDIIEGAAELIRSLGYVCRVRLRKRANGVSHMQDSYAVGFTPTESVFLLRRKADKASCKPSRAKHYVESIEKVADRDTVCIETDAPSHLFLAGTGMVPTHNSIFRPAYRPWYMKKNIEAIEAIGIERDLAGLPAAWVPQEILSSSATPEQKTMLGKIEQIVKNIRQDEQAGVVMPLVYDETGKQQYDLKLMSSGGARQFDVDKVIQRYDHRIAMSALADFLLMGQSSSSTGSFAMHSDKTGMFGKAINGHLDIIASQFEEPVAKLFHLNSFAVSEYPRIVHDDIEQVDVAKLGDYVQKLAAAGMPLFPNPTLEAYLFDVAGIPRPADGEAAVSVEQRVEMPAGLGSEVQDLTDKASLEQQTDYNAPDGAHSSP